MSVLSENLERFVQQKGIGIADLAKRCRIDRSTMYQYIRGKRPLQNKDLLESILNELRLTPEERSRVMQAFEIARIGEGRYYRRKKIKEIFTSLLTLEEVNVLKAAAGRQEVSGFGQGGDGIAESGPITEGLAESKSITGELAESGLITGGLAESGPITGELAESGLITGELKVQQVIKSIIRDAGKQGKSISLFLQSDGPFYQILSVVCEYPGNSGITHIICMDADPDPVGCDNLEIVKRVIRCGIAIRDYRPYYYYGIPSEHYGMMNIMPYFIMVEGCAMQVSIDGKAAIIHRDEEVNRYFQEVFDKMLRQCRPLMKSAVGLENRVAWGMDSLTEKKYYHSTIEMSSGLCSLQFWSRELIGKYLPSSLPDYENLLEGIACYMAGLYQAKKAGQVMILMNPVFVLEFIQTGEVKEYPSMYFTGPLEPKDRRYVLEQICRAMEEGWYHLLFLEEDEFPLDCRWEAVVQPHESLYMQYCIDDQFRIFEFEIPEVVDAAWDYLQSLTESEFVMSEEASGRLIRRWMEEYLS